MTYILYNVNLVNINFYPLLSAIKIHSRQPYQRSKTKTLKELKIIKITQ